MVVNQFERSQISFIWFHLMSTYRWWTEPHCWLNIRENSVRKSPHLFPSRSLALSSLALFLSTSSSLPPSLARILFIFAYIMYILFLGATIQQKTSNKFDVNCVGNVRSARAREACVLYAQPEIWYCSFHKHCDFYKCTHYLLKAQSPSMLEMLRWTKIHKKGWILNTETLPIHMHANGFVV